MGSKDIISMDRWPPLLPIAIAELETSAVMPIHTIEEIALHFNITVKDIELFSQQLAFKSEVLALKVELKDSTSIIRQKAKAQLETYLDTFIPHCIASEAFPDPEKVKLLKFLQELSETGGSTASKAQAKLDALPEQKTPSLNIYITPPSGEPTLVSGITIVQDSDPNLEEVKNIEQTLKKEDKPNE